MLYEDDHRHLLAIRMSTSGELLDAAPLDLGDTQYDDQPAVAFDGTNYLVVYDGAPGGCCAAGDLWGVRISTAGRRVGSPFRIAPEQSGTYAPGLAFDGTRFLVVWSGTGALDNRDVRAARVTTDGRVLDPSGIAIASRTSGYAQYPPTVAFGADRFVVVWDDTTDSGLQVHAARVSRAGSVLDPGGRVVVDGEAVKTAVAFAGGTFAVTGIQLGSPQRVFVQLLEPTLDPSGPPLLPSTRPGWPTIAASGSTFLTAWREDLADGRAAVRIARVTAAGQVQDPGGVNLIGGQEINQERENLALVPFLSPSEDGGWAVGYAQNGAAPAARTRGSVRFVAPK